MNILFICYWALEDPLTYATVLPVLHELRRLNTVKNIVLVTLERDSNNTSNASVFLPIAVMHKPFKTGTGILDKLSDFTSLPTQLTSLAVQQQINVIFAHGAPAGALAYKVWERTKLPFFVSSFEPHSDYMLESKVWNRFGLKYILQKHWEKQQKKYASGLMPVADNYKQTLLTEGVSGNKIKVVPCTVDTDTFSFNIHKRSKIRSKLNWQEATIGIYVGKYSGLYYNDEAFHIYQLCFKLIPDFRLIILSPQPEQELFIQLQKYKIDLDKVFVACVTHSEVSSYLSASDFAFATIKSYPSARFCCPIKIGEYWANGLPVLLTEGVGDESDIIKKEGGGAVFNLHEKGSIEKAIQQIQVILSDSTHRQRIPELAVKYRSPEKLREAYEYFFNQLQHNI